MKTKKEHELTLCAAVFFSFSPVIFYIILKVLTSKIRERNEELACCMLHLEKKKVEKSEVSNM